MIGRLARTQSLAGLPVVLAVRFLHVNVKIETNPLLILICLLFVRAKVAIRIDWPVNKVLVVYETTSMKMAVFWDIAPSDLVDMVMEAVTSSETSANIYQTTRRNIPEDIFYGGPLTVISRKIYRTLSL
jgi:hypothetical protein